MRVLDAAVSTGVSKVVFMSRHTVYGALPDQAQFLTEEHPPSAGRTFPEISDLVAADLYACGMMWRHPESEVVVLRPVNILGSSARTLLSRYLMRPRIFTVTGYNPMYQVIHEDDLALAIQHALAPGVRGVFNVTGSGELPLHMLIDRSRGNRVSVPEPMIKLVRGRFGFPRLPQGAVDFMKYPCTVDGSRFVEETGFEPKHSVNDVLDAVAARR
ncbi:MAG: hypothetical protein JRH11_15425 [Deltaproteobacteria bacterium]|nr:hypothetical protein [Deltaproteobacteria bacterium]